jgi:4-hydroxybenzoate polyprenyltransferase
MVTARSAAMAFNRIVDRRYDAANPRTADRPLPRGALSTAAAAAFTLVMVAGFVLSAAMLNLACLYLTPVALVVVLGYSYAKRFTALSHLWLGLSLAIAPAGAWIGVRGALDEPYPFLLAAAVVLWTAGFDVIYACLDVAFDRSTGLRSIPARVGVKPALRVSAALHALFAATLVALGVVEGSGWIWWAGTAVVAALLVYEHAIVKPDDLKRVNEAFFRVNAVVSAIVMGVGLDGLDALPTLYEADTPPLEVCFVECLLSSVPPGTDWYREMLLPTTATRQASFDIQFSPDGRRVAYPVKSGNRPYADGWILDGEGKRRLPGVCDFQFSPNGRRYWYTVDKLTSRVTVGMQKGTFGFPWYRRELSSGSDLVVDQRHVSRHLFCNHAVFSPDSSRVAYVGGGKWLDGPRERVIIVDGKEYGVDVPSTSHGHYPIYLSPVGRRAAYFTTDKGRIYLVVDGVRREETSGNETDLVSGFAFSPDGRSCSYSYAEASKHYVMVNGTRQGPYEDVVRDIIYSRDGCTVAYPAMADGALFAVRNGVKNEIAVEDVPRGPFFFSPDATRMAYMTSDIDATYVAADGKPADRMRFDTSVYIGPIAFSSDSRRMAYVVCDYTMMQVVVDGQKGEAFDYSESVQIQIRFSPDSRHVAYVAYRKGRGYFVVVNGAVGEVQDWIATDTLVFSPDSRKLAYGARKGRELWWKVIDVK